MTRQEFIDDVTSFGDLLSFCYDNDCTHICEDVVDSEYRDEYINDSLVDWARNDTWTELKDRLDELYNDTGYNYYIYDEYYGEYKGVDDDGDEFETYKRDVLEWMDDHEYWDDDGEEDEEEEDEPVASQDSYDDEGEEEPIPEEDCSFADLVSVALGCVASFNEEALRQAQEEDRIFMEFQKF